MAEGVEVLRGLLDFTRANNILDYANIGIAGAPGGALTASGPGDADRVTLAIDRPYRGETEIPDRRAGRTSDRCTRRTVHHIFGANAGDHLG